MDRQRGVPALSLAQLGHSSRDGCLPLVEDRHRELDGRSGRPLAVWFALHTIFREVNATTVAGLRLWLPVLHTVQLPSLALAAGAAVAMFHFKVGMLPTLAASALLGCGYFLLAGR